MQQSPPRGTSGQERNARPPLITKATLRRYASLRDDLFGDTGAHRSAAS